MRITQKAHIINLDNVVDVSVDVHKDTLYFYFEIEGKEYSDTCSNRTKIIEKKLQAYLEIVIEHGKNNIRIICEPTGQYMNTLLRTARRFGFFTVFVNAESVAKFRLIETNDYNKTDQKDPRVINSLGKLNKVIEHRVLSENYQMLRKLHKIYEECDKSLVRFRGKINRLMVELFCDYSFNNEFLYGTSGQALMLNYHANPYSIVMDSFATFTRKMKMDSKWIRTSTLKRIYEDAHQSVLNVLPPGYIKVLEQHLCCLMLDYQRMIKRKNRITKEMVEIMKRLRENDPLIPPPTPGVISEKNLARFLAEAGPLSDFDSAKQLMRYAGLNLRTRQSGKFQGQNKISKKGRPLLRKVMQAIVFPLVKKGNLYGEYYHAKKDRQKMVGTKAMTIVARKMLTKIFGWYRSGKAFDERRFFLCESRFDKLAKAA